MSTWFDITQSEEVTTLQTFCRTLYDDAVRDFMECADEKESLRLKERARTLLEILEIPTVELQREKDEAARAAKEEMDAARVRSGSKWFRANPFRRGDRAAG